MTTGESPPANIKTMCNNHFCFADIELMRVYTEITGSMNCSLNFSTNNDFRV